jgi:protein TonB
MALSIVPVWLAVVVLSGAVVGQTGGGRAPQTFDHPVRITNPSWRSQPRPKFPETAPREVVSASVGLNCILSPQGRATACEIVSETPQGYGFGAAAIEAMIQTARFNPRRVDGVPAEGQVTATVRFSR